MPELSRGKYDEETTQVKKHCFRLENIESPSEINGLLAQWRVATLPADCFDLLTEVNNKHSRKELKDQRPTTKGEKQALEFAPEKGKKSLKSSFSENLKVSLIPE